MQSDWFTCESLDVLAIHGYGTSDFDTIKIKSYVDKAKAAGKKLLFQEWYALILQLACCPRLSGNL